jgi:hypothetical protein
MAMEILYTENKRVRISVLLLAGYLIWQLDYTQIESNSTLCLFHALSGKYCYGCGFLKGVAACMHLDFSKAWQLNPLNSITIPLITYLVVKDIFLIDKMLPFIKKNK